MRCHRHPDRETLLSCGTCALACCPDCAENTSVGTRCLTCLYDRQPRRAQTAQPPRLRELPVEQRRAMVSAAVVTGVLSLLLPVAVLAGSVGLLLCLARCASLKIPARRMVAGALGALAYQGLLVPLLLARAVAPGARLNAASLQAAQLPAAGAAVAGLGALAVIVTLAVPAYRTARALASSGRGRTGGLLLGCCAAACALCGYLAALLIALAV